MDDLIQGKDYLFNLARQTCHLDSMEDSQTDIEINSAAHLTRPEEKSAHVYHLFVINCLQRDALQAYLLRNNIQSLIHYPVPIQKQRPCLDVARDPQGLPNSEKHTSTCLSLPCHPQMTDADTENVIKSINSFQGR